ncbi:MAG: glycosyltransferase [Bacteroidetes bacterium]|nr:glycosyltransferase [Bacteroidota bacterium]
MSSLKILHINTLDSQGGASQVAMDLIHNMEEESHLLVMIKSAQNERVLKLKRNFLDLVFAVFDKISWKLGKRKSLRAFLSLDNSFNFTYQKLKKLKQYREADIIHLHNIHGGYFDFKALLLVAKEKQIVWTLHDMWAITGGEAYTFENENYKKGVGYTPYIRYYPLLNPVIDRRQHFLEKKKKIYSQLRNLTFVPVSKWLEKCFREAYVYNPFIHLHRIENGIDISIFTNQQLRTWKKPRILFFNFDNPFKGSYLFTNILEQIGSEFDLYIVGDKLNTGTTQVHFQYIHSRQMLSDVYNHTDILIFPSLAENFPLTVLEAMACGVCVIGSDTGGIPEILDNTCGYLFKNNSQEDLKSKITDALLSIENTRKKGELAEKRVQQQFTLKKNCREYSTLYRDLLKYENWNFDERETGKSINVADFFE